MSHSNAVIKISAVISSAIKPRYENIVGLIAIFTLIATVFIWYSGLLKDDGEKYILANDNQLVDVGNMVSESKDDLKLANNNIETGKKLIERTKLDIEKINNIEKLAESIIQNENPKIRKMEYEKYSETKNKLEKFRSIDSENITRLELENQQSTNDITTINKDINLSEEIIAKDDQNIQIGKKMKDLVRKVFIVITVLATLLSVARSFIHQAVDIAEEVSIKAALTILGGKDTHINRILLTELNKEMCIYRIFIKKKVSQSHIELIRMICAEV